MKSSSAEWLYDYWKEAIFSFLLVFVAIPAFIYHLATMNPQLKNNDLRNQLKEELAKEMKEIQLPPKTAVNKFQANSKDFSIYVSTRYRTEIGQQEFVNHLQKELEKKGWINYRSGNTNDYNFCRDKQSAALNYQGQGGLFGDGGNYYNLEFTVGLNSDSNNSRPPSCR